MGNDTPHLSVRIDRPAREVYAFASDPANLPSWAPGLGSAVVREDGAWFIVTPEGRARVTFAPANPFGVLDHEVETPSGETVHVPLRAIADGDACDVVFTLRRTPGMTDADLERDTALVTADLALLKRVVEGAPADAPAPAAPAPAPTPPVISVMVAVPDAAAATAWYRRALGATELWNLGSVVGMTVGGAPFFLGQPEGNRWDTPETLGSRTVRVEVFVDDPDAFVAAAVAAGADGSFDPVRDHQAPWGVHRQGSFVDPFGHLWLVGDRSPLSVQ